METAIVILLLVIGAVFGGLLVYAWTSDKRPIIDQFNDLPESPEQIARKAQA